MATIQTGVGILPQGTKITALMAVLAHNGEVRRGRGEAVRTQRDVPTVPVAPAKVGQEREGPQRGSRVAGGPVRPPGEVPSGRLNVKFYEQWERQLMWATMRALLDHEVVPRHQAIGMARRLARQVMDEYAPLIVEHTKRRES